MSRPAKVITSLAAQRIRGHRENHDGPTDFEARKTAPMLARAVGPRSISVNGARATMVQHYEIHLDAVADLTGRLAHAQTNTAEPLQRAAIISQSRSFLLRNPVAVPGEIEHLDFSLQCQLAFLDNGFRCERPAAAYVEFHMIGYCKRFDCDENGNACGYVCTSHLEALAYTAMCIAKELKPAALVRWLSRRDARCPTCDRSIRSASDILQVVVML